MAPCLCRCRCKLLLCICSPCILLTCLFIYVVLAVCFSMAPSISPIGASRPLPLYFAATGASKAGFLASYPLNDFWKNYLDNRAMWNWLQHIMDRLHNPILHSNTAGRNNVLSLGDLFPVLGKLKCKQDHSMTKFMSDFQAMPRQIQDFVSSMHCRDYPLLIDQPRVCARRPDLREAAPMLLLAIKTQVHDFQNRQAIRKTWGRSGYVKGLVGKGGIVRRVFLLGNREQDEHLYIDGLLEMESQRYGDIIQWDFQDTFFNLTLKDVLFWQWFSMRCPHARFVFKGDDDVFVRTPALLDFLQSEEVKAKVSNSSGSAVKLEDFIIGDVIISAVPVRKNSTKYYIPQTFYEGLYPPYAGGGGVVYSGSLALRLLQVSKRVHLFPIDDVYLGMCLHRLGVSPIHHPAFLTFDFPKKEKKGPCANHTILLVHKRSPAEMYDLWNEMKSPSLECRNATLRVQGTGKEKSTQVTAERLPHADSIL
ncbi:N-acetyllactosaminide beta-1,3-N-acetylglucosaminyltransferase 2 [Chanos chanos]|uniref:Hexosyltransferase n=1 Tax=Chanos chanos TaxID=29144 RepID=A0A6J2UQH9_CHACN|nr:N-acetyllactosaminide beta-1,3-N-acetylglucosaminyltransferase 2-like [Chanos chanos]